MVRVGNKAYADPADIPSEVPVFPLSGALLLPGAQLPLNIFEPRYMAMVDDSLAGSRIIGIIQPALHDAADAPVADLCTVGCLGRIVAMAETGDGRYVLTLGGICRFRVTGEIADPGRLYRVASIEPYRSDLAGEDRGETVDRAALLARFRAYLEANGLEADWKSIDRASNTTLVNSLSMMSPYGPAEKQALLEAPDVGTRAETLIAITEIVLARGASEGDWRLQ